MGRELGGELAPGFMFALEKGARRGHRYGDVVVLVASAVDDIEQVALLARCFVLPRPPRGAFEFDGHRVSLAVLDSAPTGIIIPFSGSDSTYTGVQILGASSR